MARRTAQQPQDSGLAEELPLDPALEAADETPDYDEVVEEEEEEVEEPALKPTRTPQVDETQAEFRSRLAAEKARADTLAQALEALRQQPRPEPAKPVEEDPFKDFTPEAKSWVPLVSRIQEPQLRRLREEILSAVRSETQASKQAALVAQEMSDDLQARRQFSDYDTYADEINEFRRQVYTSTNVLAPREIAYHVVKGRRAATASSNARTNTVRKRAKSGATVEAAAPVTTQRATAPAKNLTPEQIARMTWEEAEKWLIAHG